MDIFCKLKLYKNKKGTIITYVLVFGAIFLVLIGGLLGFILLQLRQTSQKVAWNEALSIAEAGINYYRWCINNGIEQDCLNQGEKDYFDPEGNKVGKFFLQVTSTISCGQDVKKDIVSTGWTNDFPNVKRKIGVLYGRPSVAQYSYILNTNVWIGDDHEIRGPYHSNGGIRMDGTNQSTIYSAQTEWACTDSFGCSSCPTSHGCRVEGSNCICPGVLTTTANSNPNLFSFPVTSFDFNGITIDLAQMKSVAQTSGIYLPPSTTTNPLGKGYHIKFKNNGTFEAWIITQLSSTYAYSLEEDWHYDYFTIANEYLYNTYVIPSACSAIFVEDNIWPEGTTTGKVTIASANLITPGIDTDAVLLNNIDYVHTDGSDGFSLIGERNILISPQSPNNMTLRGIFIAQKGRFGRNHYPNNFRNNLEIYGSVVSNGRVGTQWTSGGTIVSGYSKRESYFDPDLIYNPSPFVPHVDSDFKIIDWKEVN
ncbi:MAG: hypothetical protein NTU58_03055 [Candidatus Nealsonbacteria bacterium]|nr:hypothetical protein [Candidatus Nealsonbacteria bacterium]